MSDIMASLTGYYGLRTDPDGRYNHNYGPAVTSAMTEEDKLKYGAPELSRKPSPISKVPSLSRKVPPKKRCTDEEFREALKQCGTDAAGMDKIAEMYGYADRESVRQRARKMGVKDYANVADRI